MVEYKPGDVVRRRADVGDAGRLGVLAGVGLSRMWRVHTAVGAAMWAEGCFEHFSPRDAIEIAMLHETEAFRSILLQGTPAERRAPAAEPEAVNGPAHYGGADNPYEAIKVIEAWKLGFNLGNTTKYISRAEKKGAPLEDLKKAAWYLAREIKNREGE